MELKISNMFKNKQHKNMPFLTEKSVKHLPFEFLSGATFTINSSCEIKIQ